MPEATTTLEPDVRPLPRLPRMPESMGRRNGRRAPKVVEPSPQPGEPLPLSDARFVEFYEVVKSYPNPYGDDFVVIDGFNFIMQRGEVVSVIGHSGCGKSTVLTMLAGLNDITSGGIVVDGREIDGPGPDRAVVFQAPCLLPWQTSLQNVMLGVDRVYPHASKAERRQLAEYYLSVVGLADAMDRYPGEMSGGMQQRVGIARAIALKPKTLLLDEPFGRLDSLTRMELQDVILEILDREKVTTVLVTHDVDEAIYMSDRVCMMTNGPRARVGQVLQIPFDRPRQRTEVLEHPDFYDLRGCLLSFLEGQEKRKEATTTTIAAVAPPATDPAMQETHAEIEAVPATSSQTSGTVEPLIRVVEVWRPNSDGGALELVSGVYRDVPEFEKSSAGSSFELAEGLPGAVWSAGKPVVFDSLDRPDFVRTELAATEGLTAGIGIPVFDEGRPTAVVLMLFSSLGTAKGAIESWLPDTVRRELFLGEAYYANLDRFRMISEYARFPMGSGLPGGVWQASRPRLETDLQNSPGFIRSAGAEADGLGTAFGIPILRTARELESVLVLLSSGDRPVGRVQLMLDVDESGHASIGALSAKSCPEFVDVLRDAMIRIDDESTEPSLPLSVARTRSAVLTRDFAGDWPAVAAAAERSGLRWGLGLPTIVDDRVVSITLLLD